MARKRAYPENILHDLKEYDVTADELNYDGLTERERAVVQMYYIENVLTFREISAEFGVSQQRMRQIISRTLRRIRKNIKR